MLKITICPYPTFKMPTIRWVWKLNEQGNFTFSIDLKDAYLNIPTVSIIIIFY